MWLLQYVIGTRRNGYSIDTQTYYFILSKDKIQHHGYHSKEIYIEYIKVALYKYIPRMNYAFYLLILKSSKKWRSKLIGSTCNLNHQILPCGILFLAFINTNVFYLLPFKLSCQLVRTMMLSFKI